jgi:DNA-binding SARP family transcriptional activator
MKAPVRFRLLGPLSVLRGDQEVDVGHPKQRCVLGVLLIEAGRPVPTSRLIERIWHDRPPRTARNALYTYVAQLRAVLAPLGTPITKRSNGYSIGVDPDAVDLHRFRQLIDRAKRAQPDATAADLFTEALALYKGAPLDDLDTHWIQGVRTALAAEHRAALLRHNEVLIRLGRHAEALGGLRAAAAASPLDELLAEQLMVVLHRSGQTAAALRHYHEARRALAEDLGMPPSRRLQRVHQQLLRADPALAAPQPAPGNAVQARHARHSRRRPPRNPHAPCSCCGCRARH